MALYPYVTCITFDGTTKVSDAVGQIYAKSDTTFSAPLSAVDASGLAVELKSNSDALLPSFFVEGHTAVVWKSGDWKFILTTSEPVPGPPGSQGVGVQGVSASGDKMTVALTDGTQLAPITLPTGPGGSNLGVSEYVQTDGPTRTALSATIVGQAPGIVGGVNTSAFGAIGDSINDDTAAIQEAIDDAAARVISSNLGESGVVYIPAGKYATKSTITQPPYVKVITQGSTIIESYVPTGAAWHVTPLATDPENLYSILKKQQWLRGHVINAANGGMVLINREAAPGTTTGLELGPRTDLGSNRPMARYSLSDVAIQGYNVGQQLNAFHHYIAHYYRMHIEQNNIAVRIGNGVIQQNSGENFNWVDSILGTNLGTNAGIILDTDAFDVTLRGCSMDFLNTVARFNYGWNRFLIDGGHIEGINEGTRRTATGGIAVSNVTSGVIPDITIQGTVPLVQKERGALFRGAMNLSLDLAYRNNGDYTKMLLADNYLCDDSVRPVYLNYRLPSGGPMLSTKINSLRDPGFSDATGTATTSLTNYTASTWGTTTATVDADGPRAGLKSLAATISGSGGLKVTAKEYVPCKPGSVIRTQQGYKFSASPFPTVTVLGTFYDANKLAIGSEISIQQGRVNTVAGEWRVANEPALFTAPAGAAFFRPSFQVSTTAGDGAGQHRIGDFQTHVI